MVILDKNDKDEGEERWRLRRTTLMMKEKNDGDEGEKRRR